MAFSAKLIAIISTTLHCLVFAAPLMQNSRSNTYNYRIVGRGLALQTYHPPSTFEVKLVIQSSLPNVDQI